MDTKQQVYRLEIFRNAIEQLLSEKGLSQEQTSILNDVWQEQNIVSLLEEIYPEENIGRFHRAGTNLPSYVRQYKDGIIRIADEKIWELKRSTISEFIDKPVTELNARQLSELLIYTLEEYQKRSVPRSFYYRDGGIEQQ